MEGKSKEAKAISGDLESERYSDFLITCLFTSDNSGYQVSLLMVA